MTPTIDHRNAIFNTLNDRGIKFKMTSHNSGEYRLIAITGNRQQKVLAMTEWDFPNFIEKLKTVNVSDYQKLICQCPSLNTYDIPQGHYSTYKIANKFGNSNRIRVETKYDNDVSYEGISFRYCHSTLERPYSCDLGFFWNYKLKFNTEQMDAIRKNVKDFMEEYNGIPSKKWYRKSRIVSVSFTNIRDLKQFVGIMKVMFPDEVFVNDLRKESPHSVFTPD